MRFFTLLQGIAVLGVVLFLFSCDGSAIKINVEPLNASGSPLPPSVASPAVSLEPVRQNFKVHLMYHIPADKLYRSDYKAAMEASLKTIQTWYAQQMPNGASFQMANDGQATVIRSNQNETWFDLPAEDYATKSPMQYMISQVMSDVISLKKLKSQPSDETWVIFSDFELRRNAEGRCNGGGAGTLGYTVMPADDLKGLVGEQPGCSDNRNYLRWVGGQAHELGHTFGLAHPFEESDGNRIYTDGYEGTCEDNNCLMRVGYINFPNTYLVETQNFLQNSARYTGVALTLQETTLTNLQSDKCIDLAYGSAHMGNSLIQYNCSESQDNFRWMFSLVGGDEYRIVNKKSQMCISVREKGSKPEVVKNFLCLEAENTVWRKQGNSDGSYQLVNKKNNGCLQVRDGSADNFADIIHGDCENPSANWLIQNVQ